MITRKLLTLIVAAGIVPAIAVGSAVGIAVAVAGDRLRSVFAVPVEWESCDDE
jgi:hypothetical protein